MILKNKIYSFLFTVILLVLIAPVCASATESTTVIIESVEDLSTAIRDQQPNQTWKIKSGTYTLTQEHLDKYKDWKNPFSSSQGNWYFPIYEDGIKIIGEGNVVITSNVETSNGSWASQDFISIWANNITIDNVDLLCKKTQNKAIEVMGQNFVLKNSTLRKVNQNGSGSIVFNSQVGNGDIGVATIDNVTLYSWISVNYSKSGTLHTNDVTIDFTDNSYAGAFNGYAPGIFNHRTAVAVNNTGLKILVDSKIDLTGQVFNNTLHPSTTVIFAQDVKTKAMVDITADNIVLDLNGNTLSASNDFAATKNENGAHLIQIRDCGNVTIKNGSVISTAKNQNAIYVYRSSDVLLDSLAIDHTHTLGGSPLAINSSAVSIAGNLDLTVGTNSQIGVDLSTSDGNTSLQFQDGSAVSMEGNDRLAVIAPSSDGSGISISGAEEAGLKVDEDGNYVSHSHSFDGDWKHDANGHWKECECTEKSHYAAHTLTWIIDQAATATEDGLKHQECTVCGYALNPVKIPATGTISTPRPTLEHSASPSRPTSDQNTVKPNASEKPSPTADQNEMIPETGDSSDFPLFMILFAASFVILIALFTCYRGTVKK